MKATPFAGGGAKVHLHLTAGSPLAELFLIDHSFVLVDRGVGELDADVEQGVYKVKAQLGGAIAERVVVLDEDTALDLSADHDLMPASPVPLQGSVRTHEFHMYPAAEESRKVTEAVGSGARIFLCARRWSSAQADWDPETSPPELSLHRPDGETIVDLLESGRGDRERQDPMVGANIEVDPGHYLLRWRDDSGVAAEQSVEAVKDWQTQVFLLDDVRADSASQSMSMLMARDGFDPDDANLRIAEEARVALADERRVASEVITNSLFAKFDNPMLGLYGAHLMLIARDAEREAAEEEGREESGVKRVRAPVTFDQSHFDGVVDNLGWLLGSSHPDVTALATQTERPIEDFEPVTVPPMLWRSWLLLIEASNRRPELLPTETWRRTLKLLPLRPFLAWSSEGHPAETAAQWERGVESYVRASVAPTTGSRGDLLGDSDTTLQDDDEARRRLTGELVAPRAAIDELAAGEPA